MALGKKTGGRAPGTPNKRSKELIAAIRKHCKKQGYGEFNPVLAMVDLFYSGDLDEYGKIAVLRNIMPYMYPKRKATAVEIDDEIKIAINDFVKNQEKENFHRTASLASLEGIHKKEALRYLDEEEQAHYINEHYGAILEKLASEEQREYGPEHFEPLPEDVDLVERMQAELDAQHEREAREQRATVQAAERQRKRRKRCIDTDDGLIPYD